MNRQTLVTIPVPAIAAIRGIKGMRTTTQCNAFVFLNDILKKSFNVNGLLCTPIGVKATSIQKKYFGNSDSYRATLEALVNAGVLEINNHYKKGEQVKTYCLNSAMLSERFDTFLIAHKNAAPKWYRIDCKQTALRLGKLVFNVKKAKEITLAYVASDSVWKNHKVKFNDEIEADFLPVVQVWNERKRMFREVRKVKRDFLMQHFHNAKFELIQNNDSFYYVPLDEFKTMKRLSTLWHYSYTIASWSEKRFFAFRDNTSKRKHTNLTNTPKPLLCCITYKGEQLKEIDLACSQYALFARCLDFNAEPLHAAITKDVVSCYNRITRFAASSYLHRDKTKWHYSTHEFIEAAANGTLYEVIQHSLGLSSRNAAKVAAMNAFFSRTTSQEKDNKGKALIRSLFPEIVGLMDAFKAEFGCEQLPIEMQRIESHLFVDTIAPALEMAGVFFETKHDSILIASGDYEKGTEIVKRIINRELGQWNYKLKG